MLIMVDDNRLEIKKDEKIEEKLIRFRTLGCYPLTGAVESKASSIEEIIIELSENIVKLIPTLIEIKIDLFSSKVNQNLNGI